MQITREINRLVIGLVILFGIVTLAAAYRAVVGPDTILKRDDNPRSVEAVTEILRGAIVDRNGTPLVESTRAPNGAVTRNYNYPAMDGALGYYSLRYGVGGAESAFDSTLSGSAVERDTSTVLVDSLLHRPQQGADIQLTFDLDVQQQIAEAMDGQRGAVVVLSVPDGAVLAMLSLPTYDPNTLDQNWDALVADPGNPFFNRAMQGSYQPGGALETPLMAAAFLINHSLDAPFTRATDPVAFDQLSLDCAVRLPSMSLTLREAYTFACPHPFESLAQDLNAETIQATIDTFRLNEQPILPGFAPQPNTLAPTPAPSLAALTTDDLTRLALGQGAITVSPLNMAMMAAAIVNDGNTPQPYVLMQSRAPDAANWTPAPAVRPSIPLATSDTARYLQDLMREAVANGAAQNAGRPNIDIGGHAALAYSGDNSLAWFVGFATYAGRKGAAVAVVLEDSTDPGLAADIGGTALAAAQAALAPAPQRLAQVFRVFLSHIVPFAAFRDHQHGGNRMPDSQSADPNAESRAIWDTNAAAWDERMSSGGGFQSILIAPTVEKMLDIQPGETVLDIACGNGIFSRRLAELGAFVVASDFSPKLIDLAHQRTTEHADRIAYHVADATDEAQLMALGAGQQFDAAVCNNALMDMPAIEPLFRAVAKLLKPEGRFVFSIMHPCFNGLSISKNARLPDYAQEPTYAIEVSRYLTWEVSKGLAISEQPVQQYYWHRPLHVLLNSAFTSGLVMDRLEEPPFIASAPPTSLLSWANYDVPPLLFARLRPAHS